MVVISSGAECQIDDIMLTCYACYLAAQNGDPRKPQIANLLCRKTRRAELIEQRLIEVERVKARAKLQETEHKLSGVLYERGVNDKSFKAKDFVAEMTSMNVADRQSYITIQEPFERFIE